MKRPTIRQLRKATYDGYSVCKCGQRLEIDTYTCGTCGRANPIAHEFGL